MEMDMGLINQYLGELLYIVLKIVLLFGIYLGKKLYNNMQDYLSQKAGSQQKIIIRTLAKEAVSLASSLYKELDGNQKFNKAVEHVASLAANYGLKVSTQEIMGVVQDVFREAKANGLLPKEYYLREEGSTFNEEKWKVNYTSYIFTNTDKVYYHYTFILKNISKDVLSLVKVVVQPEVSHSFSTTSEFITPGGEINLSGDLAVKEGMEINQAKSLKDYARIRIIWKERGLERVKVIEYPLQ